MQKRGRLFIIAAPSGTGKSTIVNYLMDQGLNMHFSISLTTRAPRGKEQNGVEYFFTSVEDFRKHIYNDDFIEYEEVYDGCFYGTLKSQVDNQIAKGQNVIFDVDVNGGINIKKQQKANVVNLGKATQLALDLCFQFGVADQIVAVEPHPPRQIG